jgi:hypothetical protein
VSRAIIMVVSFDISSARGRLPFYLIKSAPRPTVLLSLLVLLRSVRLRVEGGGRECVRSKIKMPFLKRRNRRKRVLKTASLKRRKRAFFCTRDNCVHVRGTPLCSGPPTRAHKRCLKPPSARVARLFEYDLY